MPKKSGKLSAADMLEKLKDTATHLGMDDDDRDVFVHKGMKRAGYKVTPAYSDPDDDGDDDEDEDDLMPRRRNKSGGSDTGTQQSRKKASGDGIWD